MIRLLIPLLFLGIIVWSLWLQNRSARRQKEALAAQREAIERQKIALAQADESLALLRKQTETQGKILARLERSGGDDPAPGTRESA